jgi:hypothetical protein
VGRRNGGDRWGAGGTPGAGITRTVGGRTMEEIGCAQQGGGQRESLDNGKPRGGLGRPAWRLRRLCGTLAAAAHLPDLDRDRSSLWRMNGGAGRGGRWSVRQRGEYMR